jgi:crotonobetainyl-CoA:carnitine CoA-transferase CaiB-like acyl-CoA transferase
MCASMASAAASASWFRMGPGRRRRHHGWGPPFVGPKDGRQSTYFMSCNRNKESNSHDLKSGDGKAVLRSARTWRSRISAPASWTGWAFSTVAMHGINPRLAILATTGFGHDVPGSRRSGYDQILQGEADVPNGLRPTDPQRVGIPPSRTSLPGGWAKHRTRAGLDRRPARA